MPDLLPIQTGSMYIRGEIPCQLVLAVLHMGSESQFGHGWPMRPEKRYTESSVAMAGTNILLLFLLSQPAEGRVVESVEGTF